MVLTVIKVLIISSLAGNIVNRRDFLVTPSILLSSSTGTKHDEDEKVALQQQDQYQHIESPTRTSEEDDEWKISLPLERYFGGTNCIRIVISGTPQKVVNRIIRPKRVYKLIVDTGSPYLTIPFDGDDSAYYYSTIYEDVDPITDQSNYFADENNMGFKSLFKNIMPQYTNLDIERVPFLLKSSIYNPTEDIYGTKLGVIEWKESCIAFRNNRLTTKEEDGNADRGSAIFGVLDETLTSESGGPLFGLVKRSNQNTNKVQLRPTILDQIRMKCSQGDNTKGREVTSFQIDSPNKVLTLLAKQDGSLIPKNTTNIIELVDLRLLGDFVDHYAFTIDSLILNNGEFVCTSKSLAGNKYKQVRPIVAVFDTGLTGCLFTKPLWNALIEQGVKDPSAINCIEVLSSKNNISISSNKSSPFFYASSIDLDWFDDPETAPFVVVLGQTFLVQGTLTVDINRNIATFNVP